MASKKISELTAASSADGTELLPIVQGGVTKKIDAEMLVLGSIPTDTYASLVTPPTGVDDTAVVLAAATAGGAQRFPSGTYVVDPVQITNAVIFLLDAGTKIKLKDNATDSGVGMAPLIIRSSNVKVFGGVVDANRAGQNLSTFNAAGGSSVKNWYGVKVFGTSGAHLTGVEICTKIINAMDWGFNASYCDGGKFNLIIESCGAGASWLNGDDLNIERVILRSLDNNGAKIFPHAVDIFNCKRPKVGTINSSDHFGTGTVTAGTALSDFVSGVTLAQVDDGTFDSICLSTRNDVAMSKGLGVSFLGCRKLTVSSMNLLGFSELGAEIGGVVNSQFDNVTIDGRYQFASSASPGRGVAIYNNAFYSDISSRSQRYCSNNRFTNWTIRRHLGSGIYLTAGRYNTFTNVIATANERGLESQFILAEANATFPGLPAVDLDGNKFIGCDFSYNEKEGAKVTDGRYIEFISCRFNNNGGAAHFPTGSRRTGTSATGQGLAFITSASVGLTKDGVRVVCPEAIDHTVAGTGDFASVNPATPSIIVGVKSHLYHVGEPLTLVGAGAAGADLVTRIDDIQLDEITVSPPLSTFPTVAGTGTISSSGTTVTGTGTAFNTQIRNRLWISSGGQVRQVVKVNSDTSLVTNTAFSPVLSGASFTIYFFATSHFVNQTNGLAFSSDTLSPVVIAPRLVGNPTNISDSTVAPTKLKVDSAPAILALTSDVTVVNSNVENTLATLALPIDIAAGDAILFDFGFDRLNNSGGNVIYTARLKLGATTIHSSATTISSSANRIGGRVRGRIQVVTTSSQITVASFESGSGSGVNNANAGGNIGTRTVTSAENLVAGKNLVLTMQMDTASASADVVLHLATLDILKRAV